MLQPLTLLWTADFGMIVRLKVSTRRREVWSVSYYRFISYICIFVSILSKNYFEKKVWKNFDYIRHAYNRDSTVYCILFFVKKQNALLWFQINLRSSKNKKNKRYAFVLCIYTDMIREMGELGWLYIDLTNSSRKTWNTAGLTTSFITQLQNVHLMCTMLIIVLSQDCIVI